ncbi:MAG TPA: lysophospholipid acyltransferase family protein [Verrucomicrobiae bacterium]|nr:lysophospholipid acyltransferase family protein [Verrucomicrobiae bacterium]
MKGLRRHPLRVNGRLLRLAGIVAVALPDYLLRCAFCGSESRPSARARWLQRHSRRVLRMFQFQPRTEGPVPTRGLLVSNHLGYLDVLVLSAITPAIFVSRRDVKYWPVFGLLASLAGTLYVDRERRAQVGQMNQEIEALLNLDALVVLFPEGTSSDGQSVLPFKSALLEPAVQPAHPLTIGAIRYSIEDGDTATDVCYWGDDTFFPHMLNLLSKRAVQATVRFAPVRRAGEDRKQLALRLREEILKLKSGSKP